VRWLALILLAAGLAVLADQLVLQARLNGLIGRLDENPVSAAAELSAQTRDEQCNGRDLGEIALLARALFAVERAATSHTEHLLEYAISTIFAAIRVAPPDFSYGPGQIKPSTLRQAAATLPPAESHQFQRAADHPAELFDYCHALDLAAQLIRDQLTVEPNTDGLLARTQIMRIAKEWNGQRNIGEADALIAAARYQRLVYEIFLQLRFSSDRPVGLARAPETNLQTLRSMAGQGQQGF
jgi:hypothetical protein